MNAASTTRLFWSLLILCLGSHAQAAVPGLLHYQGRLDDSGQAVNGTVTLTLRLYAVPSSGTILYADSTSVPVVDGVFNTFLGDNTTAGDLQAALAGGEVWLEAVVNGVVLSPRQRVVSAPYALRAGYAFLAGDAQFLGGIAPVQYLRNDQTGAISAASSTQPVLTVTQSSTHDGLTATTQATAAGRAALKGVAGSAGPTINSAGAVVGTSTSSRGVIGSSSTNHGVLGYSTSGIGVEGQSSDGTGVRALSTNGIALDVAGKASVSGDLTVAGKIRNPMVPIAMGFINSNGTTATGSGNFTSAWNAASNRYEITITGESYFFSSYVTQATPTSNDLIISISSAGGKLLVTVRTTAASSTQSAFQFVTYKP